MIFKYPDAVILIFTKEPVAGKVKTRLNLNPELSEEVFSFLLTYVVNKVVNAKIAPVELCVTGDIKHPLFQRLINKYNLGISKQRGENLGSKMFNALKYALNKKHSVVLMGSDCLEISPDDINLAFELTNKFEPINVLQPAYDGGFVLIATNYFEKQLFNNVDWGTEKVLQQVINNRGSIPIKKLRTVSDIDTIEDLVRALIKVLPMQTNC